MPRLRAARPADVDTLQALYRRSAAHWEAGRRVMEAHPELREPTLGDVEAGRVRVAVEGGRLVGFATVLPGVDADELDALFVEPDTMGRGVGRLLVDDALEQGIAPALEVVANLDAVGFYERTGFVDLGEEITQHGPARRMRRDR